MNKEDKEILRLTLMAFENNSANIRNIRLRNLNNLALKEVQALLHVEQKIDEVKNAAISILLNELPKSNHFGLGFETEEKSYRRSNRSFLHDDVD